jgi:phosphate transport system protein
MVRLKIRPLPRGKVSPRHGLRINLTLYRVSSLKSFEQARKKGHSTPMIRFDNHAFKGLDDAFKQLFSQLSAMSDGATQLIALLPGALEHGNEAAFLRAKDIDKTINDIEREVDSSVARIINKFTVMGEDLRFTLGAVKISGALERASDKIKNCVKRLSRVSQPIEPEVKEELAKAIASLKEMLPMVLGQVIDYRPNTTEQLLEEGAKVQKAYRTILIYLHAHKSTADDETHLLLVAKNLEQAADMIIEVLKASYYIHFATKFDKRSVATANA